MLLAIAFTVNTTVNETLGATPLESLDGFTTVLPDELPESNEVISLAVKRLIFGFFGGDGR